MLVTGEMDTLAGAAPLGVHRRSPGGRSRLGADPDLDVDVVVGSLPRMDGADDPTWEVAAEAGKLGGLSETDVPARRGEEPVPVPCRDALADGGPLRSSTADDLPDNARSLAAAAIICASVGGWAGSSSFGDALACTGAVAGGSGVGLPLYTMGAFVAAEKVDLTLESKAGRIPCSGSSANGFGKVVKPADTCGLLEDAIDDGGRLSCAASESGMSPECPVVLL